MASEIFGYALHILCLVANQNIIVVSFRYARCPPETRTLLLFVTWACTCEDF